MIYGPVNVDAPRIALVQCSACDKLTREYPAPKPGDHIRCEWCLEVFLADTPAPELAAMTRDARQFWERVPKVDADKAGQKAADDFEHIRKVRDEIREREGRREPTGAF